MVTIDLTSATTPQEMATIINQQFPTQVDSDNATLQSSMNDLTTGSGQNCAVLGSIGATLRNAEAQLQLDIQNATKSLESVINQVNKKVGDIVSKIQSSIATVKKDIADFTTWLNTQTVLIMDDAKAAIQSVCDKVNSVIQGAMSYINQVTDAIDDIAQQMYNSLKNLIMNNCSGLSDSIKDLGSGSGIDPQVSTAKADDGNATAMSAVTYAVKNYSITMQPLPAMIPTGASQATVMSNSTSETKALMDSSH